TQTMTSACGGGSAIVTSNYTYDGQRRLIQVVQNGQTTTYTAWDSAGRPTAGTIAGGASFTDVYDSGATTDLSTTTSNGAPLTVRLTYDTNGILLSEAYLAGAPIHTVTWTINSTGTVCK
ncbi:MAG: hypothetical protein ACRD1V_09325, partial [Vicinamibacterales bacterium]